MGTLALNQVLFGEHYDHQDETKRSFSKNAARLSEAIGKIEGGYYFGRASTVKPLLSQALNLTNVKYGRFSGKLRDAILTLAKTRLTEVSNKKFTSDFESALVEAELQRNEAVEIKELSHSKDALEIAHFIALQLAGLEGNSIGFRSETTNQIGSAKVTIIVEKTPTT